ncbi:MAG: hypothetical protein ACHQ4J_10150 [Candidatus Binatia bacterium]
MLAAHEIDAWPSSLYRPRRLAALWALPAAAFPSCALPRWTGTVLPIRMPALRNLPHFWFRVIGAGH